MCGRFTQHFTWSEIHAWLSVFGAPRNFQPRYNISPTDTVDVLRSRDSGLELVPMRWGLIPAWWKKPLKELPATFNARADTVDSKPMFRSAFKDRRCIVPASGFFEWTGAKGDKQGHYFTAADGSPILAFAGLWDRWHDPDQGGQRIESCTFIVSDASDWMQAYHDRLAITLTAEQIPAWLDGSMGHADIQAAHGVTLREWPVSRRVNNGGKGKDDDPGLIEPSSQGAC